MKVIINTCFGGFSVSEKVYKKLGLEWDNYGYMELTDYFKDKYNYDNMQYDDYYLAVRSDPDLVKAVEELGVEKASGSLAELKIVEIPDDVKVYISNYDGIERIEECHRSWD